MRKKSNPEGKKIKNAVRGFILRVASGKITSDKEIEILPLMILMYLELADEA